MNNNNSGRSILLPVVAAVCVAAGLLLGIQLAKVNGDSNAEASYSMALRNLYPQSAEYQSYQRAQHK